MNENNPLTSADVYDELVSAGVIASDELARARELRRATAEPLAMLLPKLGVISETELATSLAGALGLRRWGVDEPALVTPLSSMGAEIPSTFWRAQWTAPVAADESSITIAVVDPTDDYAPRSISYVTARRVERVVATRQELETLLEAQFPFSVDEGDAGEAQSGDFDGEQRERLEDLASEAPVIRWVQRLITDALDQQASDIHLEPTEAGLTVRFRKDGILEPMPAPPPRYRDAVISRIKVLASLNIAERRLPQDGRIRMPVNGRTTDFRVVTSPCLHGESAVLRILDRQEVSLDFDALGLDAALQQALTTAVAQPFGIVLVTGPTGSGKTTTLYSALKRLNQAERKILTVEDPIEYTLVGVNQTQVRPDIGYTFAAALRSFLRQDPDVLMVGEIRDRETAEIAIQAALTGHLLLSTLHTNTAAAAIVRLMDMGVDDYLLTSTLNLIVGQRLVRRLCRECRSPQVLERELLARIGFSGVEGEVAAWRAHGCPACRGRGYRGRTSLMEMLPVTPSLQREILRRPDAGMLERAAVDLGMRTMLQHGLERIRAGDTTLEEVLRVTRSGT